MRGFSWRPGLTGIDRIDFGAVFSVEYKTWIANKHGLSVQLQDNFGLRDINKDNAYGLVEKNHSLCLLFSYCLKLPLKN